MATESIATTQAEEIVIDAKDLAIQFGDYLAVHGVTVQIPRGKIFGFIGPSGSGKTTTVRLITGLYKPTAGRVTVLGEVPNQFDQAFRRRIGYMPQHFVLYPTLTVEENLNFAASIYGMSYRRGDRLRELLQFVELEEHRKKLASKLSGGMKRRLSLAATLVHAPELLFLDEPTAGIDPVLRRKFWDHFNALKEAGHTLFITTQYVGEAAYCDHIGVMVGGELLMIETPKGLRHRAYGGEVVDLRTKEQLTRADLFKLRALDLISQARWLPQEQGVRLVVEEASRAIPALLEWCRDEYLTVDTIEEYLPPFDDVFVELVKKASHDE